MKKGKKSYKVYEGLTKRKQKFLVAEPFDSIKAENDFEKYAKRFFRCSKDHLVIKSGYIYKGELYFEKPSDKGYELVNAAYYKKAV